MGAERYELLEQFLFGLFSQQSGAWQLKRKALHGILVRNTQMKTGSFQNTVLWQFQTFGLTLIADSLNAPFRVQEGT